MSAPSVDVVILGAGPYGLSIAAHLYKTKVSYRIFGQPMQSWQTMMPRGMVLKTPGVASSLYDPEDEFPLRRYCAETGQPYSDNAPVALNTFLSYGLEFQRRLVPELEQTNLTSVRRSSNGFEMETEDGERVRGKKVIVAAGITHFGWLPPVLASLPTGFVTHSSSYGSLAGFKGRKVAVVGAGAAAVDIANNLHEAGAEAEIVSRLPARSRREPSMEQRSLIDWVRKARSGPAFEWRTRLCTAAPLVFHAMPEKLRHRVAADRQPHPAQDCFARDEVAGRVQMHLGVELKEAAIRNDRVHLKIDQDGSPKEVVVDHVIGGTGYRASLQRLKFLDPGLRDQIRVVEDTPKLSRQFESSVNGLYFVGMASANSFGPLTGFTRGARFTAKRLSSHLAHA
jgi:cation diffusion facilitator CzcD-associated flavoprotein CzcO